MQGFGAAVRSPHPARSYQRRAEFRMDLGACKSFDEKVCGHFSPLSARGGLSFKFSRFYRSAKNEVFRFGEFSIAGGNARAAETGDGRRKRYRLFGGV